MDNSRFKFSAQKRNAKQRGIAFKFTYDEWARWWKTQLAARGPDATRGRGKGQYVMARYGDKGAYEPSNVYCATTKQNLLDQDWTKRIATIKAGWVKGRVCHLGGKRGDAHPKSRPVMTPQGRYGSMVLAAEAYSLTRQAIFYKLQRQEPGWTYETR